MMGDKKATIYQFPSSKTAAQVVDKSRKYRSSVCQHNGSILVDEQLAEIECGGCGERLNPMWFLVKLAREEQACVRRIKTANALIEKADKRTRTKCQHCGQMTRIRGL